MATAQKTTNNKSQLISATKIGDEAAVRALCLGSSAHEKTAALLVAVRNGRAKVAEVLLEHGADINATYGKFKYTVLIEAVVNIKLPAEFVELLINAGANVNVTDNRDVSPLLAVALTTAGKAQVPGVLERGFHCMQLLLKAGSPINKFNDCGWNAYDAIQERALALKPQILILLVAAGEYVPMCEMQDTLGYAGRHEPEMTLKNLAREAVRKHMIEVRPHENLFVRVPKLGIFPTNKSYLLYDVSLEEEYKEIVTVNSNPNRREDEADNWSEESEDDDDDAHGIFSGRNFWKDCLFSASINFMQEDKDWEKRCKDMENN